MPSLSARRACVSTQSSTVTRGKSLPQARPVSGLIDCGPGRAEAASQVVDADDEKAAGVDRLVRPDHVVPPADVLAVVGVVAGHVMRRVERMAHEHGVGGVGVELAVRLVGDVVARQPLAAGKLQRLGEGGDLRLHFADRVAARDGVLRRGGAAGGGRERGHQRGRTGIKKKPASLPAGRAFRALRRFSRICSKTPTNEGFPAPASWFKSARSSILAHLQAEATPTPAAVMSLT